jgi:hypothetical protein
MDRPNRRRVPIRKFLKYTSVSILFLIVIGYVFSDDVYYRRLVKKNNLEKPVQVFNWLRSHYFHDNCTVVHAYASPRHVLENHRRLFCDEAAIAMATLVQVSGYQTRLVNLISTDGDSHHTILEVAEAGQWHRYDFTNGLIDRPIVESATGFVFIHPDYRKYPRLYNFLVNHNFFFKKIIFLIRGISETDVVN